MQSITINHKTHFFTLPDPLLHLTGLRRRERSAAIHYYFHKSIETATTFLKNS